MRRAGELQLGVMAIAFGLLALSAKEKPAALWAPFVLGSYAEPVGITLLLIGLGLVYRYYSAK